MKKVHALTGPSGAERVLQIEFEHEDDGRWITDIPALPGVMAYGATRAEARSKVENLSLRTLSDRLEHGEQVPDR
jgi:predicted RNase H-like HicB family nuclease